MHLRFWQHKKRAHLPSIKDDYKSVKLEFLSSLIHSGSKCYTFIDIKILCSVSTLRAIWFLQSTRTSTTNNTKKFKIAMGKQ
jgi:hypothetical protein